MRVSVLIAAVSFCASPLFGPASGDNLVRITFNRHGCAASLQYTCDFGGALAAARYNASWNAIECAAPRGAGNTTVPFLLRELSTGFAIPFQKQLYFSYLSDSALRVTQLGSLESFEHFCSDCASFNTGVCFRDCTGTLGGSALVDSCGICSGGTSGHIANSDKDCQGTCFGPWRTQSSGLCACPLRTAACLALTRHQIPAHDPRPQATQYVFRVSDGVPPLSEFPPLDSWTVSGATALRDYAIEASSALAHVFTHCYVIMRSRFRCRSRCLR